MLNFITFVGLTIHKASYFLLQLCFLLLIWGIIFIFITKWNLTTIGLLTLFWRGKDVECFCERPLKTLSWGNWRLIVWILPQSRHIAEKIIYLGQKKYNSHSSLRQCKCVSEDQTFAFQCFFCHRKYFLPLRIFARIHRTPMGSLGLLRLSWHTL